MSSQSLLGLNVHYDQSVLHNVPGAPRPGAPGPLPSRHNAERP